MLHNCYQKYIINRPSRGTKRLTHKYDSKKKYLFNATTSGTPFEKSAMLSYVSTPIEKSFNLNMNTATKQFNAPPKPKHIKTAKRFATK